MRTEPPYQALQDANRFPTNTAVSGTAGTSDTTGTAEVIRLSADPSTGAQYVYNLGPAGSVTLGNTPGGTIDRIGSIDTIGTMPSISVTANPESGTLNTLGTVGTILGVGGTTITSVVGGTIQSVGGTVSISNAGTNPIPVSPPPSGYLTVRPDDGTVGFVGTVGSINTIGTLPSHAVTLTSTTISAGTINTIVAGTQNTLGTVGTVLGLGGTSKVIVVDATGADLDMMKQGDNFAVGADHGISILGLSDGTPQTYAFMRVEGVQDDGELGPTTGVLSVESYAMVLNSGTRWDRARGDGTNGAYVQVRLGTLQNSGTTTGVGTITNLGSVTNIGTLKGVDLVARTGNIGTIETGTISTIVAGTLNTLGTVGVVNNLVGGTLALVSSVAELVKGTITNVGTLVGAGVVTTVSNLTNGSINILSGTLQNSGSTTGVGTVTNLGSVTNIGTLKGVDLVTRIGNIGTIESGTVTTTLVLNTGTITTIAAGTQNTLGTVGVVNNIVTGTLANSGTTTGVGTITNLGSVTNIGSIAAGVLTSMTTLSNLTNGSINILTGTLQSAGTTTGVGVVSNLTNGSINILSGTLQNSGTTTGVGVVSNLTNGSVNLLTGTVTSVTNLAGGTIKLNPVPVPTMLTFGTLGKAGGSFFATISAASGAGTIHYISGVDIVMQSGTADVRVLAGTAIQGTGVLAAGQFPAGGGISKRITPAFATGTNSEITYHFVGAGTAFITVNYWKGT